MTDVLSAVRLFLNRERDLFGESMIVESPHEGIHAAPRRDKGSSPEPELFDHAATGGVPHPAEPWTSVGSLSELDAAICDCVKCSLGYSRTKFVFGVGNPHASLLLVGEAPGADEDARGEPFVGRAGQLLNKILAAINFTREEVYICNILKCRPPNNRAPSPEEVDCCMPYLRKQIELIRPKLIVCLGLVAAKNLLNTNESLTRLRGRVLAYQGFPVMVTFHPAALLRNPNNKPLAWKDVQAVRKLHDELVAQGQERG
jgi:uracil-DNA glycosylase family 4